MEKTALKSGPHFGLIQMGTMGEVAVRVVAANLQTVLGVAVDILEPRELPPDTFVEHRKQYEAGLILKHLAQVPCAGYLRIIAVTNVDLCIPILTYVFGEAEVGGRVAVVSGYRLRHDDDGTQASLERYYERLAKVALHETAHTLSLYHCEAPNCLMHFSAKVQHLDEVEILFCDRCEFMLHEQLRRLPFLNPDR